METKQQQQQQQASHRHTCYCVLRANTRSWETSGPSPEDSSASRQPIDNIIRLGGMRGAFESAGPISATDGVSDNSGLRCNRSPASRDSIYRISEINLSISCSRSRHRSLHPPFSSVFAGIGGPKVRRMRAQLTRQERVKTRHTATPEALSTLGPAHSTELVGRQ